MQFIFTSYLTWHWADESVDYQLVERLTRLYSISHRQIIGRQTNLSKDNSLTGSRRPVGRQENCRQLSG